MNLTAEDLTAAAAALDAARTAKMREATYSTNYGEQDKLKREARSIGIRASKFRSAARRAAREEKAASK